MNVFVKFEIKIKPITKRQKANWSNILLAEDQNQALGGKSADGAPGAAGIVVRNVVVGGHQDVAVPVREGVAVSHVL